MADRPIQKTARNSDCQKNRDFQSRMWTLKDLQVTGPHPELTRLYHLDPGSQDLLFLTTAKYQTLTLSFNVHSPHTNLALSTKESTPGPRPYWLCPCQDGLLFTFLLYPNSAHTWRRKQTHHWERTPAD